MEAPLNSIRMWEEEVHRLPEEVESNWERGKIGNSKR